MRFSPLSPTPVGVADFSNGDNNISASTEVSSVAITNLKPGFSVSLPVVSSWYPRLFHDVSPEEGIVSTLLGIQTLLMVPPVCVHPTGTNEVTSVSGTVQGLSNVAGDPLANPLDGANSPQTYSPLLSTKISSPNGEFI